MDPCLAQLNERLESAVDGMFRPPIELASPFGGRGGRVPHVSTHGCVTSVWDW